MQKIKIQKQGNRYVEKKKDQKQKEKYIRQK